MKLLPFHKGEQSRDPEKVAKCVTPDSHGAHSSSHLCPGSSSGSFLSTETPTLR